MLGESLRRAPWTAYAAFGFNLIPIIGVSFWGWSAFALIFLYWLENVAIGVRTLFSVLLNGAVRRMLGAAVSFAGFFAIHYGIFCFGHGVFVTLLFGGGQGSFDLVATARGLLETDRNLSSGLASIAIWQALLFGLFIIRGDAARTNSRELMVAPYPRIVVLHIAIIFGGGIVMVLNEPLAGVVMLALLKTAFDVAEASGWRPKAMRDPETV